MDDTSHYRALISNGIIHEKVLLIDTANIDENNKNYCAERMYL